MVTKILIYKLPLHLKFLSVSESSRRRQQCHGKIVNDVLPGISVANENACKALLYHIH